MPTSGTADRKEKISRHGPIRYFLLAFAFWAVVDFGTAGGFRIGYLQKYAPGLLLTYAGWSAVFTVLIYVFRIAGRGLILPTVVAVLLEEVVIVGNPIVATFPACLAGIPLGLAVYFPLVYFPLWIVRGEMGQHARIAIPLSLVILTITFITTFVTAR